MVLNVSGSECEDPRYPKQGACLEYDAGPGFVFVGFVSLQSSGLRAKDGWVKLGYRDPVMDFASDIPSDKSL